MDLWERNCLPCHGGVPVLTAGQIAKLLPELHGWECVEDKKLVKEYKFKNFAKPMALANRIAEVAEGQNHHPDLLIAWGRLHIELWTHAIEGLSESDFVLAAKIDHLDAA